MKAMPPDAVDVNLINNNELMVKFANGEVRRFNMTPLLQHKGYAPLRNPALLAKVFIQYGCVTWPGDIDIDPDWLYEDSVEVISA